MKIAINYSDALFFLLDKNPKLGIDYIKAPIRPFPGCWEQFEDSRSDRARLPHLAQAGVLLLGHPDPGQRFDAVTVNRVLQCTNPPYLSTHLSAQRDFFPGLAEYQHQNHPAVWQAFMKHFLKAIVEVKTQIKLPLVLENCPYYVWWHHFRLASEPQFITDICRESGCGFLLDIAHARCSAWHMQMDVLDYINGLPLNLLREIHLGGIQKRQFEGMRDTHTALDETDYQLLAYLLQRTDPEIITIEYGGMPDYLLTLEKKYEPIVRNSPVELEQMIVRVQAMIGAKIR
jgi:Uncharacterized protein conserved in bacteria